MSYVAKTDWKHSDPISENDLNRWENGIKSANELKESIDTHTGNANIHVTTSEKNTWNGGQLYALTANDGGPKGTVSDANTALTVGVYLAQASTPNAPSTAVGILIVRRRTSSHFFQEYWEVAGNSRYSRSTSNGGSTWTTWKQMASTDLATASANGLMSSSDKTALDNAQKYKMTENTGLPRSLSGYGFDLNNAFDTGIYVAGSSAFNTPPQSFGLGTVTVANRDGNSGYQTMIDTANEFYYRAKASGNVFNWRRVISGNVLTSVLLGQKLTDTQMANFVGKVSGSTAANPHLFRIATTTRLIEPSDSPAEVINADSYAGISSIGGTSFSMSRSGAGQYGQVMMSFNLIEHVERIYGSIPGLTTTEKISWLRVNVSRLICNWWGFGSGPNGNKATISYYTNTWLTNSSGAIHTSGSVAKISAQSSQATALIQSDGFVHFLAYADPSNGTTASIINTDYVELNVELSTSLKDNMKPVWIDATLQNGWTNVTDSGQTPQYSIDSEGFVSFKGAMRLGSLPGVCMTLPAGFRPIKTTVLSTAGAVGNLYRVTISSGGAVTLEQSVGSGGNQLVYIDGIRFPTN
ncbi:hypothetical protein EalM137_00064 [Exiguobacterium phage vB_EalM-137]|nr:hypothetical protein EalM137_00064 [Exiguobacterium phage vB_EalM-137]